MSRFEGEERFEGDRGSEDEGEGMGDGGREWRRYDPERLAVYRLARAHTRALTALLSKAKTRGFGDLVDDVRRAAKSVTANIKEGYGEHRPAKKLHFYQIAKGSITEAWGHTDSLVDFGLVTTAGIEEIRDLQNQIIALLITMIRNLEAGGRRRRPGKAE